LRGYGRVLNEEVWRARGRKEKHWHVIGVMVLVILKDG